ncbi:MAG: type II toxin-antitoxin system HicB family antitoxin [Magnetococcus sp. YQC-5]
MNISKIFFPITIEPGDEQHAFGVVVPDLPGCFSAGDTLEEAMMNAKEAIVSHMECMIEEGIEWPEKKTIKEHTANPDFTGWLWAVIEVDDIRENVQSTRINITLPKGLLTRIDTHATTRLMSRSGFLAYAARKLLETENVNAL